LCRSHSFLHPYGAHPALPSFPTRRSSDLSRHHPATVEVLLGEVAREATVSLIIGLDRRQRAHRIVHRSEPEQARGVGQPAGPGVDRKSTRLNSSHVSISYAVFCLKKKKKK